MNCLLADDEPLARKGLENFIKDIPYLDLKASCSNALEVLDVLSKNKIDLMFLDIQMPKMTGISLLKTISKPPICIITTAYPNYAVESFELAVIDYLLKPIPFERFTKATQKAKEHFELQKSAENGTLQQHDYCFIKCDKTYEKINFSDLLMVEALQNYIILHTVYKKYITYLTLKSVEEQLPSSTFMQVNKSYIINTQHIQRVEGNEVSIGTTSISIGRSYKDAFMDKLLRDKLLKR